MVDANFRFNVKHNRDSLSAVEQRLLITTADPVGRRSIRRRQGLREWPRSVVDNPGLPTSMSPSDFRTQFPDIPLED